MSQKVHSWTFVIQEYNSTFPILPFSSLRALEGYLEHEYVSSRVRVIECTSQQSVSCAEFGRLWRCLMQYTLWKETVKKVETEKEYHKGYLKRVEQLKKEYEDNILLYNNIRSQRNRFLHLLEVSIVWTQFSPPCKGIHDLNGAHRCRGGRPSQSFSIIRGCSDVLVPLIHHRDQEG